MGIMSPRLVSRDSSPTIQITDCALDVAKVNNVYIREILSKGDSPQRRANQSPLLRDCDRRKLYPLKGSAAWQMLPTASFVFITNPRLCDMHNPFRLIWF